MGTEMMRGMLISRQLSRFVSGRASDSNRIWASRSRALATPSNSHLKSPEDADDYFTLSQEAFKGMALATTETVPGKTAVEYKGFVAGGTVKARHVGVDIFMQLRSMLGGELRNYTQLQSQSRLEATIRMIDEARKLGANGVVGIRFMSTSVSANTAEHICYGTAVLMR
eukprot:Selendium_serpulae@DN4856_c0_g1_i2.p2